MLEKVDIEKYYVTIAPALTNYLTSSGSTYETSCEIVQETFLKIWKMREEVDNQPEMVSGLIWKVARNLRTDRFRRENKIVLDEEVGMNEVAPSDATVCTEDRAYLRRRIKEALAALPPLLRDTYTLFHIAELSVREIAQQTNSTEQLVKVRIFRAKQKLQEQLKDLDKW